MYKMGRRTHKAIKVVIIMCGEHSRSPINHKLIKVISSRNNESKNVTTSYPINARTKIKYLVPKILSIE